MPAVVRSLTLLVMMAPSLLLAQTDSPSEITPRRGIVRVEERSLVDEEGPLLGLGVSYFTALHRCRHDRDRLERDLEYLAACGFNYTRMLSMVGWYGAWEGREIAPVGFTNRDGKEIAGWPDYWSQLGELIDLAYDRFGLRTQVTLFADAQLMPSSEARRAHVERFLAEILPGREHKIMLIEVANEAWQNGFEGEQGVAELRELARLLKERTKVPVAITSNHHETFEQLYRDSGVDLATWHFSRDRRPLEGWLPVFDCWDFALRPGCPPVVSNEPIGPGSSVDAERDPTRLVMAPAFAYVAGLPAYVFHCEGGVFGRTRFEETPAIALLRHVHKRLPPDVASWKRHDGRAPASPFLPHAGDQADSYRGEGDADGCLRLVGARKGDAFVSLAMGIGPEGLRLDARTDMNLRIYSPLDGKLLAEQSLGRGEPIELTGVGEAVLVLGEISRREE